MDTIEEFMHKYGDSIKNGIIEEGCIGDFFDIILEVNRSEKREILSNIRLIYHHMLKYLYQPDHQSASWIKTIRNCYRALEDIKFESKNIWNSISMEDLEHQYANAKKDAMTETHLPAKVFPKDIPSEDFDLGCISNSTKMEEFLRNNAYMTEAKKYLYML